MTDLSVLIQKAPNLIDIINKNRNDIDNILNKINSIYNNIDLLDNVVSAPLISYPSQAIYGSTVTLKASSSITAFRDNGAILDTYIWELPDNSIVEGDTITYTMPDNSHIGETITIKCRAKDILGNYSKYSNIDISVTNIDDTPIIDNVIWDKANHIAGNSYTLTINAHDPNGDNLTYELIAIDDNITIIQNINHPNIFTIDYPGYPMDIVINYTIKVTDTHNATATFIENKLVHNNLDAPIIDSVTWDNDDHYAEGVYTLTINAHDPNTNDILTYNVISNDSNVIIVQDTIDPNIFHVTYPSYSVNTVIMYTITVTDNHELSTISIINQLVHYVNHPPVIDSTVWDDSNHYENGSYTLTINAHDPDSGDTLNYSVTCNDTNISIVQDTTNLNIFTVTYPEYTNDTVVTYTITVTDSFGDNVSTTLSQLVNNINHPPVIDSVIWNNTNHYENGSYILTINAHDPDSGDNINNYTVTCNDPNVTISQDATNRNVFTVTYPEYTNDTIVTYTITVTDSYNDNTTTSLSQIVHNSNNSPIIDSTSWDDSNHYENGSYTLTIDAHDPDVGDSIIDYSVTCSDTNVTVTQDATNPNIFTVTYPEYTNDVTVTYTITVTDSFGATDSTTLTQLVHNNNNFPIIDDTSWNNDLQYENNSYTLTITAHDPDSGDTLNYAVTCDDTNVTVTQDATNPNIFHIDYPEYTNDVTVTYTVTVTDNHGDSTNTILTKLVHNINHPPVIDSTSWDDDDHYENGSYTLTITAHDPDVGDSIDDYTVTCNDPNVTITQDATNPNIFHVTYPEYTIDTTVTYNITVTDTFNAMTTIALTKLIHNINHDPVIDNITWDDDDHYENGSYILTINAHDPDSGDSITNYTVSCDDTNVTVTQDATNPNIFTVTYPEYTADTTVTYTITVTDSFGATDIIITTKLVHNNILLSGDRGVFAGGYGATQYKDINYIAISTLGNANIFGDLLESNSFQGATSNGINDRGIFAGGYSAGYRNTIEYITISTLGDAQDFGDLTSARYGLAGTSNGINDRGVFGEGQLETGSYVNTIEYITISTLGDAIDFGDLTLVGSNNTATSNGTNDRGVFWNSWDGSIIDYITISILGNASNFGNPSVTRSYLAGTSNGTNDRGVFGGGFDNLNIIDYITISTLGDALDFGDLILPRHMLSATSNGINDRGVFGGGYNNNLYEVNDIDYITIPTLGDALNFGDLYYSKSRLSATSDG